MCRFRLLSSLLTPYGTFCMSRLLRRNIFVLFALASLLSACSSVSDISIFPGVHKLDLQQGNIIDQDKLDQLQLGMSRAQVQFVMGTPLVADTFDLDRWDYLYEYKNADGEVSRRGVTLRFEAGALTEIDLGQETSTEAASL